MRDLAHALRRMRLLRGLKQTHVAERLAVTQATVSRWERGTHRPSPAQMPAVMALLAEPAAVACDGALKRLVESSSRPVHLICDTTHRLLAASPARQVDWAAPASVLMGQSLWSYASREIEAAEARLDALGWRDSAAPAVAFDTGANCSAVVPIVPGVVVWERLCLDGGSEVRLVSTFAASESLPPGVMRL